MKLIIANKNYSSWSLRGWLALKAFDVPFEEINLKLFTDEFYQVLESYGAAGKVPVLVDDGLTVWDSLAICEYVNDKCLSGKGWPDDLTARAQARSYVAEMHSGFMSLRNEMPMNCRARRMVNLTDSAKKDIEQVDKLWSEACQRYSNEGPWLFGQFSLADVFYAPVVLRFVTYGIEVSEVSQRYMDAVMAHPAIGEWLQEALKETEIVELDEAGEDRL